MSNNEGRGLAVKVHQLAELIAQARPGKMRFESEEQFLAMLSFNPLMSARVPVRYEQRQYKLLDVACANSKRSVVSNRSLALLMQTWLRPSCLAE